MYVPITTANAQSRPVIELTLSSESPRSHYQSALMESLLNELFSRHQVSVNSVETAFYLVFRKPRLLAVLFGSVGGIALVLSGLGLYAVASFEMLRRRTRWDPSCAWRTRGDIARRMFLVTLHPVVVGMRRLERSVVGFIPGRSLNDWDGRAHATAGHRCRVPHVARCRRRHVRTGDTNVASRCRCRAAHVVAKARSSPSCTRLCRTLSVPSRQFRRRYTKTLDTFFACTLATSRPSPARFDTPLVVTSAVKLSLPRLARDPSMRSRASSSFGRPKIRRDMQKTCVTSRPSITSPIAI